MLAKALPGAMLVEGVPRTLTARAVIDASHPCESQTHADIAALCAARGVPLLRYARPGWRMQPGDDWRRVADGSAARAALDPAWQRVFLCLGQAQRAAFAEDAGRHYLVRSRRGNPVEEGFAQCTPVLKAGPFTPESEIALMRDARIEALVTRDAGGEGAYPKIAAARALGLPVVLLQRPPVSCPVARDVEEVRAWLASL